MIGGVAIAAVFIMNQQQAAAAQQQQQQQSGRYSQQARGAITGIFGAGEGIFNKGKDVVGSVLGGIF